MDEQIVIAYKDTDTGFTIHPGLTSIHIYDARLLIKIWTVAATVNRLWDIENLGEFQGLKIGEEGQYTIVSGVGTAWRNLLNEYNFQEVNLSELEGYTKKLLGFAPPAVSC